MFIQPSVQSASYGATFTSSMSPTGVEQTVSRAPLPPVEETSRDSASQNRENPYLSTPASPASAAGQKSAAQAAGGTPGASQSQPAESAEGDTASADQNPRADDSVRQQQQEAADQALLAQLRARDREVRLHEAAHAAVGGRYAGAPAFQYDRGPDGRNYAVGGEVSISTGPVPGDPQATIEKARIIRAAALAPAEPSAQDRRVAAEAAQLELDARSELQQQEVEARAAAQKSREQTEAEKRAEEERNAEAESQSSAAAASADDTSKAEAAKPEFAPVAAPARDERNADSDKKAKDDEPASEPRPNARERLEQILLGTKGILDQANRQGLTDPQNPYGKSGFLDIFA